MNVDQTDLILKALSYGETSFTIPTDKDWMQQWQRLSVNAFNYITATQYCSMSGPEASIDFFGGDDGHANRTFRGFRRLQSVFLRSRCSYMWL